ncbi:hypothetical protein ACI65C_009282 [Semiaphis heraclei]
MAASASLAVSIPTEHRPQEPAADSSNVVMHKKHTKPEKIVFMSEVSSSSHVSEGGSESGSEGGSGLLELGLSGLLEVASAPKKIIGAIASFVFGKLKFLDLKKLVKITMLAALVTVLGAVASVAVAGFVSVVTVVCTVLPYLKLIFGGHHQKGESTSESQIDLVSEFVMGAIEKYSDKRKA